MHDLKTPHFTFNSFTLIELLVVVAIISVLAAMLLPSLQSAKFQGQKIRGMSNLRQAGVTAMMYYNDYRKMPDDGVFLGGAYHLLFSYAGGDSAGSNLFFSTQGKQAAPGYYYSIAGMGDFPAPVITWNANLKGAWGGPLYPIIRSLEDVRNPSSVFLMAHAGVYFVTGDTWNGFDRNFTGNYDGIFHRPYFGKGTCFYYVDGHVQFLQWNDPWPAETTAWNVRHPNQDMTWWPVSLGNGMVIMGP
jgi:prepilin-type N-terminal cleavage/methylation domain-containing protein